MKAGIGPTSEIARRQRGLLVLCLALALAGGWALWPHSRAWALLWAGYAMAGWWVVVLAWQAALAQRSNRAAWRAAAGQAGAAGTPPIQPLKPLSAPQALRAWLWSCWEAPQVFFWRQPFREWRWPDRLDGATPDAPRAVLFVHGFVSNRGFWNPWLRQLSERGEPFAAISLSRPFAVLDEQAAELCAAVDRVIAATGRPPLVVAHSMGGLVVRAWLRLEAQRGADLAQRVHRAALIASPIAGTGLSRHALGPLGAQMRRAEDGGTWAQRLDADLDALGVPRALFACWASSADNMVFPAHTALLPGAEAHVLDGVPHVPLALHPEVMRAVLALR
jgi:triacylglycerol esterase/lipase EstA (alpha/beta hydrolase family)